MAGRETKVNGETTSWTYYGDSAPGPKSFRLANLQTGYNGSALLNFQYGYDAVGNIAAITDMVGGTRVQSFTNDTLDRLATAGGARRGYANYSQSYGYDALGDVVSKTVDGTATTYTYTTSGPGASQPHAVITSSAGGAYGHDANGSMTTRSEGGATYAQTFDAENRLVQVSGGAAVQYTYNGGSSLSLQGGRMSLASAPSLDWAEAPPLSPAAFLALCEMVHPHEMAYRRSRLKGATRFFGLDLHREYVVAYAVDEALNPVVKPTTLP